MSAVSDYVIACARLEVAEHEAQRHSRPADEREATAKVFNARIACLDAAEALMKSLGRDVQPSAYQYAPAAHRTFDEAVETYVVENRSAFDAARHADAVWQVVEAGRRLLGDDGSDKNVEDRRETR